MDQCGNIRFNVLNQWLSKRKFGVMLVCSLLSTQAFAIDSPAYLTQWLTQPNLGFGSLSVTTSSLRSFYASENYQPIWTDANGLTPRATKALEVLSHASEQGLNPERYGLSMIHSLQTVQSADADTAQQVHMSLEVLMSHAVMRYVADMQGGAMHHQWDTGHDSTTAQQQANLMTQALAAPDAAAYLSALEPNMNEYATLKNAYQHYMTLAVQGGWPQMATGEKIKPGMHDARLPTIRQILVAQGDLAAMPVVNDTNYDAMTVTAVKHFQERHSLDADGTIGATTQSALAVPVAQRLEQIAMTMERMRWMPKDLGSRYVLVNVPGYHLTAVADGKQMGMDVIVGKPSTPTPMFSKDITDIVLNPTWGVPQKIAMNEMLPKIQKNPDYLQHAGFTLIASSGEEVDPASVDWHNVNKNHFAYSIRQNSGEKNALGKVKFNIPNSDDIYLHDTSQHGLFVKADRSLSHGCVRLSDPKALTKFVLDSEGWNDKKIETAYDSTESRTLHIKPMPVHLVYWTSWVDAKGAVHFGRDIYGMDKTLLASMKAPETATSIHLAMN